MDFSILEEFVIYSKYLNLSKTAPKLHCSTATLSRHLNQLESELGCDLFIYDSEAHRHELTLAGTILLEEANKVLSIKESLASRIQALKDPDHKSITIAYQAPIDQTATDLISLAQDFIQKKYGPVVVNTYSKRESIRTAILDGSADIARLHDLEGLDSKQFTAIPLFEEMSVAIVSRSEFENQTQIGINQLSELDLVWASDDFSDYQQYVLNLFQFCKKKPRVILLKSAALDYYFMQNMKGRFYIASKWHMDHYLNSFPLSVRKEIKILEITGIDTRHRSFAVYRNDNPNTLVSAFAEAMGVVDINEYY